MYIQDVDYSVKSESKRRKRIIILLHLRFGEKKMVFQEQYDCTMIILCVEKKKE